MGLTGLRLIVDAVGLYTTHTRQVNKKPENEAVGME